MKANHYYTLQSSARVGMHSDVVRTQRIEWVGEITLDLCIEEYRSPMSSSDRKENSKQGKRDIQRQGNEGDHGTSTELTNTDKVVLGTRPCVRHWGCQANARCLLPSESSLSNGDCQEVHGVRSQTLRGHPIQLQRVGEGSPEKVTPKSRRPQGTEGLIKDLA